MKAPIQGHESRAVSYTHLDVYKRQVSHQPDKALGEVLVMGQGPQRRAVSRKHYRFSLPHAADHLPKFRIAANGKGHHPFIVNVGGPNDRHRKAAAPVFCHQQLLAGDFVSGILPIRIFQRSAFRNHWAHQWLLIRRPGSDKEILAAFSPEIT